MTRTFERAMALSMLLAGACATDDTTTDAGIVGTTAGTGAGTGAIAGAAAVSGTGVIPSAPMMAGRSGGTAGATPATAGSGPSGDPPAAGGMAPATAGMGAATAGSSAGTGAPVAGSTGTAGMGMPPVSSGTSLPPVATTDGPGPWGEVVKVMNTPPGGWMIYPKEIGKNGVKHPLYVFGPGGGTTPQTYEQMGKHWDRYGSYGLVIYVLPRSTGDGAAMKAGLDWLIEQNDKMDSPLYQKLDTTKVCAAGHSQGSVTTFDFMPDDRVTTTIHISGGSFDGKGPSNLKNPTMFLCGPTSGADVAFPQCESDFQNTKVPTYYTNIMGSDHLTSGRLGWEAIIAWMMWHLAGDEKWKKEFLEPTGKFQMGIYKAQVKNW